MAKKFLKQEKRQDFLWLLAVFFLCAFGLLMVYDASSVSAETTFGDKYYFLKEQAKWLALGIGGFFLASVFDYRQLYKLSPILILGTIFLLGAVFFPGLGVKAYGASRWLDLRLFILQPAELAKLSLVIYLSAWFSQKEKGRFWAFSLLCGLVLGLIIIQPDMGTAVVLAATSLILYFLSGAPFSHFLFLIPPLLIVGFALIKIAPYRFQRWVTFLNPQTDPLGVSYQLRQILIALGSGGLFGLGLGQSRQKYEYLPEAMTDSIFAVIGEELGFIGAGVLILIFLFIFWQGFKISQKAPDNFGKLLAAGITSWLGVQTLVNLSSMVALIPLTGVPLPFISYGGSSLVMALLGIGILYNISRQRK